MPYYDHTCGRRIHRALHRRPTPVTTPDPHTAYIRRTAADHPRATAAEVHAEIRYGHHRHDISLGMVRTALAGHRAP